MKPCVVHPMVGALILVCSATPFALSAQAGQRIIKGTVVDSVSGKPVSGSSLYRDRTIIDQRTAKDGTFRVDAGPEDFLLAVRRSGYVPTLVDVPAASGGGETDLGMIRVHQIKSDADRAAAREADLRMFPRLGSFYDRKEKFKQGAFWTPDDLERSSGQVSMMVRSKTGFREICVTGRQGELDCGKKSDRGPSTLMGSGQSAHQEQNMCFVRVWTDDIGPERSLDEIQMNEILAMEAYPTTQSTPEVFPGSNCATIRLWMKKAVDGGARIR